MSKPKKSIEERIQKAAPDFADAVVALDVPALNAKLLQLSKAAEENMEKEENDEDLENARAAASEAAAPYRDAKKMLKIQSKYVMHLLKEKGGA